MANVFYDPGAQRADRVRQLFAGIAPRYDLINDLQSLGLHRYWKSRMVDLARPSAGLRALDLCCGTGDLALLLAGRGAQVTGLDFSSEMLGVAARRRAAASHETAVRIHLVQGDAMRTPFGDDSFDIVTVGYGLRNLADWRQGLSEMLRVAKPGARLLVLDFGKPDQPLWRAVYFGYLRLVVPWFGRAFCGNADAYAYILESLKWYPAQQGVAARMRELGLIDPRVRRFLGGVMTVNHAEKPRRSA